MVRVRQLYLSQGAGFFPRQLSDEHAFRAPVVNRHHDTLPVLSDDGIYLKVAEAQFLVYFGSLNEMSTRSVIRPRELYSLPRLRLRRPW